MQDDCEDAGVVVIGSMLSLPMSLQQSLHVTLPRFFEQMPTHFLQVLPMASLDTDDDNVEMQAICLSL